MPIAWLAAAVPVVGPILVPGTLVRLVLEPDTEPVGEVAALVLAAVIASWFCVGA